MTDVGYRVRIEHHIGKIAVGNTRSRCTRPDRDVVVYDAVATEGRLHFFVKLVEAVFIGIKIVITHHIMLTDGQLDVQCRFVRGMQGQVDDQRAVSTARTGTGIIECIVTVHHQDFALVGERCTLLQCQLAVNDTFRNHIKNILDNTVAAVL